MQHPLRSLSSLFLLGFLNYLKKQFGETYLSYVLVQSPAVGG